MPELPEVEVVRRGVERWAVGRRAARPVVHDVRSLRRHDDGVEDFAARVAGRTLDAARRRGKYLWIPLSAAGSPTTRPDGSARDEALVIHLGMSGQVLVQPDDAPAEKHLKVVVDLGDVPGDAAAGDGEPATGSGRQLRFVDQRIFGGLQIRPLVPADHPSGTVPASIAHIGPDPLEPAGAAVEPFFRALRRRRSGLKRALLDQTLRSGIGNIYADEALWRARLHFARRTETVTRAEAARVLGAVREVMEAALEAGGTSFDALYVNVNGESGYFSRGLDAYGRTGEPCRRCATPLRRTPFMGRSSHWCPRCQPRPRSGRW
ncbi:bifunctional DNA-formamidopyrimidine glycosylase/DNA-(apurinic or apyrimidinic site) lyase [Nesterenkonia halophila]|uniref:bifunctional DNA-formamidopyrimidine glycosylase/DNA-(apurinic or apyrimidinic site) lyase n=1 Tax=Nesterenkonia halophila TaxID=302044 RepID=UPI001290C992|nr:bifunctional DNA-formamidopyrimidine glycosylase/DNA-(apurinic or apyrimidinic site) lyase [Nesterenkonia halophila]